MSSDTKWTGNASRYVIIAFPKYIKLNTSRYSYTLLDLFANIGGYIGLFLGLSIFQIKDGVGFIIKKFNQLY